LPAIFKRQYGQWLLGIIIPLLLTLIDWPFRHLLTPSNILLVYLLGVFFVAIRLGLWPSILASLSSAAAFAFFFAPPIFSFAIDDSENWVGLGVMLIVGAVTSNLAENARHQAQVAKQREQQIQAESLRNSLLSSISHDLRTPLASIVCAATTLESDLWHLPHEQRVQLLRAISEEALRMSDLTSKILDMARLEAGEVVLNRQWYAPEEIIGCALARLDKKLKHRPVYVHLADNLSLIQIDEVLLQQVLVNLLDNADKYSPVALPIEISVESTSMGLAITVADRGIGIPEGLQEKIFDKFFRVHHESAQSGVGLGLSICKAIVEAHGGSIQVKSRLKGGSVFAVQLPLLEFPSLLKNEVGCGK